MTDAEKWVSQHPNATLIEAYEAGRKGRKAVISLTEEEWNNKEKEFIEMIKPYADSCDRFTLQKFYLYWAQRKGSKLLWELQPAFDVPKRLATFKRNNYGRNSYQQKSASPSVFERASKLCGQMQPSSQSQFDF